MQLFKPATLLIACLLSATAFGQIETDRPDFTESPNVVPHKSFQVETGFVLENTVKTFCGNEETYRNSTLNTALFRYGISERTELRLNWNYVQANVESEVLPTTISCTENLGNYGDTSFSKSGFEPFFVGIKTNLIKTDRLSLGLLAHIYLPFGAKEEFSISHYAPEFLVPLSIDLSDKFGLAVQFSMSWDGETARSETGYTVALGYAISDALTFYVEPYGYIPENSDEDHRVNGGFTYLLNDNLQIDLTGGLGIKNAPDGFIGCGVSVLLPKK